MAITVSISRKDLVREGACYDGLALFDEIKASMDEERADEGVLEVQWTPLHALWAAVTYPAYCEWLTDKGLIPRPNLAGAYLAHAYLKGAYLAGAYLSRADLYGADLSYADLTGADLTGADLSRANLAGADLYEADLAGARRRRTDPAIEGWEVVGAECDCCVYLRR